MDGVSSPESCDHSSGTETEALDGFEVGEAGVGFAHDFAIEGDNAAVGDEGLTIGCVESGVFGPAIPARRNLAR